MTLADHLKRMMFKCTYLLPLGPAYHILGKGIQLHIYSEEDHSSHSAWIWISDDLSWRVIQEPDIETFLRRIALLLRDWTAA